MTVTRAIHELKCWPQYFAAVRRGEKNFEIRLNDRDFAVGDTLLLQEYDPAAGAYTGQVETRLVSFVLSEEGLGVIHGYVAIGFGPMPQLAPPAEAEEVTAEVLAAWHAEQARNAALRAEGAQATADAYRRGEGERRAMMVAADRQAAVAELAHADYRFHAAAADLVGARA